MATVITALIVTVLSVSVLAIPEQGKWIFSLDQAHQFVAVSKHMYNDSKVLVSVSLHCEDPNPDSIEVSWLLQMSPCAMEFISVTDEINKGTVAKANLESYMQMPQTKNSVQYEQLQWVNSSSVHLCTEQDFPVEGAAQKVHTVIIPTSPKNTTDSQETSAPEPAPASDSHSPAHSSQNAAPSSQSQQSSANEKPASVAPKTQDNLATQTPAPSARATKENAVGDGTAGGGTGGEGGAEGVHTASRKKRDQPEKEKSQNHATSKPAVVPAQKPGKPQQMPVATTWVDGNYLFILHLRPGRDSGKFKAEVTIRMFFGEENYISAMDYPLLIFYGLMGLIYIGYGLVWLLLLACNWRDLLRVQFWIGGVILLGMLEKAVFFAEYENITKTGQSVRGAVIFAELVSCMKRTLARMLVIIVSLGFGIVKPRLGQTFHKVLFVGGLYFILASIEGCMRALTPKADQSNQFLLAAVPLAVLEAIICWWIFSSLIQTTRTLRLRRNVVKLTLYRHFTNTLIFAVLASIACMVWSMTQHRFKQCIEDWKQLWIDEAFWHMLFVVLLFIIMLLWRPTANNQRYAFSPLLDAADEEDDEDAMMNDAFDGMKMRGVKPSNGSPKPRDPKSKVEDDLKWVEENIPSSVADKALPTLLDSDEELMTTKFEMSKME